MYLKYLQIIKVTYLQIQFLKNTSHSCSLEVVLFQKLSWIFSATCRIGALVILALEF